MSNDRFALFATALGACAIVWNESGIILVRLPSESESGTKARVLDAFPDATMARPPPVIAAATEIIAAAISGESVDFSEIELNESGFADFQRRVYGVTRDIAPGSTLTYGEVAARAGDPGAAQAVGQCLGANPFPVIIPCHRVIGADGKMIGFSASGGVETKRTLLEIEGAFALDKLPLFSDE